ncbi:hypothetical protein DIPPA_04501 [Diplonema papillatum]|nr:hypothetical protein DIPPA_04501 [Diplonema papillatum]
MLRHCRRILCPAASAREQRRSQAETKQPFDYAIFGVLTFAVPTALYILFSDYFEDLAWSYYDSRQYKIHLRMVQDLAKERGVVLDADKPEAES